MLTKMYGRALLGLAILVTGTGAARAGSFSVAPVRATLSAQETVQSLTVRNTGTTDAIVQLEVLKWSQQDGKDIYEPARDVLATPPVFTVPAQGLQVIRVGLRAAPDATREQSYRLFLTEVPPPPTPGETGLQIALQLSLPTFIRPAATARPVLQWRAARSAQGLKLSVSNSGTAHVQIRHLTLSQGGTAVVDKPLSDYVLPGQTRSWLLTPTAALASRLQVKAESDAGEMDAEVGVDP